MTTLLRNPVLVWFPILLDVLFILFNWKWYTDTAALSNHVVQFSLPVGLPTVGDILPLFTAASIPMVSGWWAISAGVFLVALHAFIQGGYITWLNRAVNGKKMNWQLFLQSARAHFFKLYIFYLILLIAGALIALIFSYLFGRAGIYLFLLIVLVVRVMYMMVEYIIVTDDRAVIEAIIRSRQVIRQDWKREIYKVIGILLGVQILFYLVGKFMTFLFPMLIFIIIYLHVMVFIQIRLMQAYMRVRR